MFKEYMEQGVSVLSPPERKPWAYEMFIKDLDGNILWLGTDPDAHEDRRTINKAS